MQVEVANAFIAAASTVLSTEAGVQVTRTGLSLARDSHVTDDVTVLISLVGDLVGIAFYSMHFDTAKAIVSAILGSEIETFDELAMSGVSEMGNVITGRAGMQLAEVGFNVDISVPTLIVGKGSRISTLDIQRLVIPLETGHGIFRLDLALRAKS